MITDDVVDRYSSIRRVHDADFPDVEAFCDGLLISIGVPRRDLFWALLNMDCVFGLVVLRDVIAVRIDGFLPQNSGIRVELFRPSGVPRETLESRFEDNRLPGVIDGTNLLYFSILSAIGATVDTLAARCELVVFRETDPAPPSVVSYLLGL